MTSLARLCEQDGIRWDNRKSNPSRREFWALCPFHSEKTASFKVDDDKGFYYCFGCHAKGDAVTWLTEKRGMGMREALDIVKPDRERVSAKSVQKSGNKAEISANRPENRPSTAECQTHTDDRAQLVASFWKHTEPVPLTADHPVRKWAAKRGCWHPLVTWPPMQRWIPAGGRHQGAGSIVAALMPVASWLDDDPRDSVPTAIQMIAIDRNGNKCLDKPADAGGLDKRTLGPARGCVHVIGQLHGAGSVSACEGIADGMAIASTFEEPVVCMAGTAGFRNEGIVSGLAAISSIASVQTFRDGDNAGMDAALAFADTVRRAGFSSITYHPGKGNDPAALLAGMKFPEMDEDRLARMTVEAPAAWRFDAERKCALRNI